MLKRRVATPPTRRNTRTSQSHPLTKRLRPKGIDSRSTVRNAGPFQMLLRRPPPPCMRVFMGPLKIPLTRLIGRGTLHVIDDPHFNRCARRFELQAHLLLERREDGSTHGNAAGLDTARCESAPTHWRRRSTPASGRVLAAP